MNSEVQTGEAPARQPGQRRGVLVVSSLAVVVNLLSSSLMIGFLFALNNFFRNPSRTMAICAVTGFVLGAWVCARAWLVVLRAVPSGYSPQRISLACVLLLFCSLLLLWQGWALLSSIARHA